MSSFAARAGAWRWIKFPPNGASRRTPPPRGKLLGAARRRWSLRHRTRVLFRDRKRSGARVLRLLRRQGRREPVQRRVAGDHGPPRQSDCHQHGQRLSRPADGIRAGRAGAPTVLERSQIRIGDRKLFERIDAYSAPRLAEYFDPDPCRLAKVRKSCERRSRRCRPSVARDAAKRRDNALGVTVEAAYTVGEYDILILSGRSPTGFETWPARERLPDSYRRVDVAATYISPEA